MTDKIKVSEKRKQYLKDYYQKNKQDREWGKKKKVYQAEYRNNPENLKKALDKRKEKRAILDQAPGLAEKNRAYFREAKRKQMLDPETRKTVNENWVKRHKANFEQNPEYGRKRNDYSIVKYYKDIEKDPSCHEAKRLRARCAKYGISVECYIEMVQEQNNLCAICRKPETQRRKGKVVTLAIDYCHSTGKVRDLLCAACNTGLGLFNESVEQFENSIAYLKRHARGSSNGT